MNLILINYLTWLCRQWTSKINEELLLSWLSRNQPINRMQIATKWLFDFMNVNRLYFFVHFVGFYSSINQNAPERLIWIHFFKIWGSLQFKLLIYEFNECQFQIPKRTMNNNEIACWINVNLVDANFCELSHFFLEVDAVTTSVIWMN